MLFMSGISICLYGALGSFVKIIATEYMTAGKKERAFEVLNLALRFSARYKTIVGREVAGYTDVKRAVKELSKEI